MFEPKKYDNNILAYHGPISIELVSTLGNYVKLRLTSSQVIISRVHKVFVELVQNVSYYPAEWFEEEKVGKGIGWVSVDQDKDKIIVSTGNLINRDHGPVLERNCNEINSLSEAELRALKRKTRSQANGKDIGAHIGLIQTGMICGRKLDFKISQIDKEHSYFNISVAITK